MLKYTEEHEWLSLDGEIVTVGITKHAAELLGDLVFVQLPETGTKLTKDGAAAVVESVKAASDVFAPLDGEVTEINQAAADNPALVNEDPQGRGWLFKMKIADRRAFEGLMDEATYNKLIA